MAMPGYRLPHPDRKRSMHTMNALHAGICMDRADTRDPFRGRVWLETFLEVAAGLGYTADSQLACQCKTPVCLPQCQLVLTKRPECRSVWPHDQIHAGDCLINNERITEPPYTPPIPPTARNGYVPTVARFREEYVSFLARLGLDRKDLHNHQCPYCATVYAHARDCRGSHDLHRCPGCGIVPNNWGYLAGTSLVPQFVRVAPDMTEFHI